MMEFTIRRANDGEAQDVADLWTDASRWLHDQGTDQWQYPVRLGAIKEKIAEGVCWVIPSPDGLVATATLDTDAAPELWAMDDPTTALYLHRLVVRRNERIPRLGAAIIDWAGRRAIGEGKRWLRLDAWTSNGRLHDYYRSLGFDHVRTVSGGVSGVLFQRPASVELITDPRVSNA